MFSSLIGHHRKRPEDKTVVWRTLPFGERVGAHAVAARPRPDRSYANHGLQYRSLEVVVRLL